MNCSGVANEVSKSVGRGMCVVILKSWRSYLKAGRRCNEWCRISSPRDDRLSLRRQVCQAFDMSHEQLTDLAVREPPGCNGVNFLPYLTGERTPNWPNSKGTLLGLSPGCALQSPPLQCLHNCRRSPERGFHASFHATSV